MISYHIVKPTQILPEESVAARALGGGRPATARSFRLHRPRAGCCGAGWCDQCGADPATGDPLCQTPTGAAVPTTRDPLRALGLAAEHQSPWFWEKRLLRPRRLRDTYLHTVRRLSSAPGLPPAPADAPPAFRSLEVDVLHVGDPTHADPGAHIVDAARGEVAFGIYEDGVVGVTAPGEVLEIACRRLVVATGAYLRLPPIPGNDLPGVLSVDAIRAYRSQGADLSRLRVAAVAPAERTDATRAALDGLQVVDLFSELPEAVTGRGRVQGIRRAGREIACDALVLALDQPAVELALLAGARGVLSEGPLPVVLAEDLPDWVELRGRAAERPALPGCRADPDAFACPCEDVRVRDLRAAVDGGLHDVELIKRRTGAMTGPCQGKLCQGAVLTALRDLGVTPKPITPRPFAQLTRLADLACADA